MAVCHIAGSLLAFVSILYSAHGSPAMNPVSFPDVDLDFHDSTESLQSSIVTSVQNAVAPVEGARKNLLQKSGQQLKAANAFDAIWMKYSEGGNSMNLQQLNLLLQDTDHEFGEQVVSDAEWRKLCKEMGVDPSQGLSKKHLLDLYAQNPGSSIQRDYIRIFVEGASPAKDGPKNLLQKSALKGARMFDAIWEKYSQGGDFMNLQQLNSLLQDTDHEFGEQVVSDSWWQSICKELGVDSSKGLSKQHLLELYRKNPESSIKRDYFRIFIEGVPAKHQLEEQSIVV